MCKSFVFDVALTLAFLGVFAFSFAFRKNDLFKPSCAPILPPLRLPPPHPSPSPLKPFHIKGGSRRAQAHPRKVRHKARPIHRLINGSNRLINGISQLLMALINPLVEKLARLAGLWRELAPPVLPINGSVGQLVARGPQVALPRRSPIG